MTSGVIVFGMHRSGSSCLAGMLQHAGFFAGKVLDWNEDNRKGNRENPRIIELNNQVLGTSGGNWHSPPGPVKWTEDAEIARQAILTEFEESGSPWMFKDPRTVFTLSFWLETIESPRLLGIFRSPMSAARSLVTRNGISFVHALTLWIQYNERIIAWREQRPFPVLCFDLPQDEFLSATRSAIESICPDFVAAGKIDLAKLDEFFDPSLVHQNSGAGDPLAGLADVHLMTPDLVTRITEAYAKLCTIAGCPELAKSSASTPDPQIHRLAQIESACRDEDFAGAYAVCREMLAIAPQRADLWMRLLGLAKRAKDPRVIRATVDEALSVLPDDSFFWLERARLNWDAGKAQEAVVAATRASQTAQSWLEPRLHLAGWEFARCAWLDVRRWLEPAIAGGKANRWSKLLLGIAWAAEGEDARGTKLIAQALFEMSRSEQDCALDLRQWAINAPPQVLTAVETHRTMAEELIALQHEMEDVTTNLNNLRIEIADRQPINSAWGPLAAIASLRLQSPVEYREHS